MAVLPTSSSTSVLSSQMQSTMRGPFQAERVEGVSEIDTPVEMAHESSDGPTQDQATGGFQGRGSEVDMLV